MGSDIKKKNLFVTRHEIFMSNNKISTIDNNNYICENIYSADNDIMNSVYNKINNPYQKKINLINLFLNSNIKMSFNSKKEIIMFFN